VIPGAAAVDAEVEAGPVGDIGRRYCDGLLIRPRRDVGRDSRAASGCSSDRGSTQESGAREASSSRLNALRYVCRKRERVNNTAASSRPYYLHEIRVIQILNCNLATHFETI
jgi:hypothetical protein